MNRTFLPLLLMGCASPPVTCPNPDVGVGDGKIAVATATDSFDAGTLTLVDIDTGEVCDDLLTLTGDTVLDVVGGELVALDRKGHDRLRAWTTGDWDRPVREFSTGRDSNPHDVVRCGDDLVVSLYGAEADRALGVFDAKGRQRASVDLSDFGDADGKPEVSDLIGDGSAIWAAAQRLDRTDRWLPSGPGALIRVDCADYTVDESWDVPENPRIGGDPTAELVIGGGDGRVATWTAAGGVAQSDPAPAPVTQVAVRRDGVGLLVTNDDLWFSAQCLGPDGPRALLTTDAFLSDAVIDGNGDGWLAVRGGGWNTDTPPDDAILGPAPGVWRIDLDACEVVEEVQTALAPYDLATW